MSSSIPLAHPLWDSVRRLNQLFHVYDFEVEAWLSTWIVSRKRSVWAMVLLRVCEATVPLMLFAMFEESSQDYYAKRGGFAVAALAQVKWLAVSFSFCVFAIYCSMSVWMAFNKIYFNRWRSSGSNMYWLTIMLLHWMPMVSLAYALQWFLLAALYRHAMKHSVYSALLTIVIVADCVLAKRHRYHASDLLPLQLPFTLLPYSIICWHLVQSLTANNNNERGTGAGGLMAMVWYWLSILVASWSAFGIVYGIGRWNRPRILKRIDEDGREEDEMIADKEKRPTSPTNSP